MRRWVVFLLACASVPCSWAGDWRCLDEGDSEPSYIRVDDDGGWWEWRGTEEGWSEPLCEDRVTRCSREGDVYRNETFSIDPDTRGSLRVVDTLDVRSGARHLRALDATFVLVTGARVEVNLYGQCEPGSPPKTSAGN